ncbi:MAG: DMT family transporter [Gemmatimonadota bacterium]|nr:DMT family transporter [Gemmatimonadota bacterium]
MPLLRLWDTARLPSVGLRYMAMGAFWFSLMSLLVKVAGERIPSQQVVLARGVITLVLSYALVRRAGVSLWGRRRGHLVLRGFLGFVALSCFYFSLVHLPIAEATMIQYMNPVFTALLAAWLLRERMGIGEAACVALSFAGVVLVARPSFLFGGGSGLDPLYVAIALAGALFSAGAYTTIRTLTGEHPHVIVFYLPLVTVPATIPLVVGDLVWPTPLEWLVLLGVGVTTQIGQVYLTRGLQMERAGKATAVGYLQIVFAVSWGALFFGERPDFWALVGAALIVAGTLALSLRRSRPLEVVLPEA